MSAIDFDLPKDRTQELHAAMLADSLNLDLQLRIKDHFDLDLQLHVPLAQLMAHDAKRFSLSTTLALGDDVVVDDAQPAVPLMLPAAPPQLSLMFHTDVNSEDN